MRRSQILGVGSALPARVVTNVELGPLVDVSHEWIVERTGVEERRWVGEGEGPAQLGASAAREALGAAGMSAGALDLIVLSTLTPEHEFPGTALFVQRELGIAGIPAIDLRQQCSGFIYSLAVADQFIRTGAASRVLVVGTEVHSTGLDLSPRGRDVTVLFGDGAGAIILGSTEEPHRGVLSTHLHSDGAFAEALWTERSGSRFHPRITAADIEAGRHYPKMQGKVVFRHALSKLPAVIGEALAAHDLAASDIDLLIPHQANLRINQLVPRTLGIAPDRVVHTIQRHGNTTSASIPLALDLCVRSGRVRRGDLVCFAAFGAGFTWGSALVRW
jgi:3-oxoacyl-[acyl-carrier-protein] synthase-3